ncbi:hypothetical protein D3C80_1352900 [compost metagenome]
MHINGAPGIAFETGVEQPRWVLQCSTLGESQLHHLLVGLAGAENTSLGPHRNAPPLPLFNHLGGSLPDQRPKPGQRLAPPVAEFPDSPVYPLRGRACLLLFADLVLHRFHDRHRPL